MALYARVANRDGSPALAKESEALAVPGMWQAVLRQGRHHLRGFPIKLDKWLTAMWLLANCKNGIQQLRDCAGHLGVTQKSAWFMLHRIREAMKDNSLEQDGRPGGPVEVDETFIGGKSKNMHRSRKAGLRRTASRRIRKDCRHGDAGPGSRQVRAKVIPNVKRETLQNEILNQIEKGSTVYTDKARRIRRSAQDYVHETVNHIEEYVRGQVHTQGIENFWSLLKRGLKGTYVAVEPFHLDRYVDEQVFRYNNRATKDNPLNDADRFMLAVSQIAGKRLTYAELTGKVGETTF